MRKIEIATTRFWKKVDKTSTCWNWTGARTSGGYGNFSIVAVRKNQDWIVAHRYAYQQLIGPVPDGMDLDHLCRNRRCVNPAHLEAVSRRENLLRGNTLIAKQIKQTECKRGHSLSGKNLQITSQGKRNCRTCLDLLNFKYGRIKKPRIFG